MSEPENLTPAHLRCAICASCPSIHRLEDGRLLVVAPMAEGHDLARAMEITKWEIPEVAIIISPDLLDTLKAEWVREAADALTACQAERDALKAALVPFAAIPPAPHHAAHYWAVVGYPDKSHFTREDLARARAALVKP